MLYVRRQGGGVLGVIVAMCDGHVVVPIQGTAGEERAATSLPRRVLIKSTE